MTSQQFLGVKPVRNTVTTTVRSPYTKHLEYVVVPFVVTTILMITSINQVTITQVVAAFVLLLLPWVSYRRWLQGNETGLPIFALIAGLHWLYFSVALFWGNRRIPVWYVTSELLSDEAITAVLYMVIIGMLSFGLGLRVMLLKLPINAVVRASGTNKGFWDYIRFLLVAGVAASYQPNVVHILGEAGRQWIVAFQTTVPLFAAILLLRKYFQGSAAGLDKALILFYIASRVITGLGSGWSGSVFYLGIALGLVYMLEKRRIPIAGFVAVLMLVVFLQPAKSDFRNQFWYGEGNNDGLFNRVTFWLDGSIQDWQEILSDPTGEAMLDQLRSSMLRVSLLTHAANVYAKTPDVVPFQGSRLYEFTISGLIPRFLWPDKPSGNDANRYYQVAYGVTPDNRLSNVSIAIGYLVEAYISFGWSGIVFVMAFLGIVIGSITKSLFPSPENLIVSSIGLLVILSLLRVESQMGLYLVSTIQSVVVAILVLLPLAVIRRSR